MAINFETAEGGKFLQIVRTGEIVLKFSGSPGIYGDDDNAVFCTGAKTGIPASVRGTVKVNVMEATFAFDAEAEAKQHTQLAVAIATT